MIDLFVPPKVRVKRNARVHRSENTGADRYAKFHAENRERRLQAMRDRYQARKAEYKAKARKWVEDNPERHKELKRAANKRYNTRRKLKAAGVVA